MMVVCVCVCVCVYVFDNVNGSVDIESAGKADGLFLIPNFVTLMVTGRERGIRRVETRRWRRGVGIDQEVGGTEEKEEIQ